MATNDTNDLSHLSMLYPELVDEAMRSDEPITEKSESGEWRLIYRAVNYNPNTETAYMCYLDVDTHPDYEHEPSVHFLECHPTANHDIMQEWSSKATGALSGPQKLDRWLEYFAVFKAATQRYQEDLTDD
ncbi:hypothetical protein OSG_eHP18_00015 [environmental Halophage eHP-18]|nr:hypothetical protein OSG_eHP18_00015 [environmental Halophage eHP-18]